MHFCHYIVEKVQRFEFHIRCVLNLKLPYRRVEVEVEVIVLISHTFIFSSILPIDGEEERLNTHIYKIQQQQQKEDGN